MKILIHAGRHKTGTSSLQWSLSKARHELRNNGVLYPAKGVRGYAHHELAESLTAKGIRNFRGLSRAYEIWRGILFEAKIAGVDKVILSSEAFQNCKPEVLREFFLDFEVDVVFFVRNKVHYAASAFVQKVSATRYSMSMDDFVRDDFHLNYADYFSKWESVFRDKLHLHRFGNSEEGFDVVRSFFGHYLPELDTNRQKTARLNNSLGFEGLLIKKALNINSPSLELSSEWRTIHNLMQESGLDSTQVEATPSAFFRLSKGLEEEDAYLRQWPGFEAGFRYEYRPQQRANLEKCESVVHEFLREHNYPSIDFWTTTFDSAMSLGALFERERRVSWNPDFRPQIKYELYFEDKKENFTWNADTLYESNLIVGCSLRNSKKGPIDLNVPLRVGVENTTVSTHDVSVILPEGVLFKNQRYFRPSVWMSKLHKYEKTVRGGSLGSSLLIDETLAHKIDTSASSRVNGTTLYCYVNVPKNFYHWHFEILARVHEFMRTNSFSEVDHIFVGEVKRDSWKWHSLMMLGVPEDKILTVQTEGFEMERAIIPVPQATVDRPLLQGLSANGSTHYKGWSQDFVLGMPRALKGLEVEMSSSAAQKKRLFVNRTKGATRRIKNENEVLHSLAKFGFEPLYTEAMSYEEQVKVFSQAEIVVGIHGAGLTNCLWMPTGGKLLELVPYSYPDVSYRLLAGLRGLDYHRMDCVEKATKKKSNRGDLVRGKDFDILVHTDELEAMLSRICS